MRRLQISREDYLDRVQACWMGKNIGGTLGMPYECNKSKQNLSFYDPLPQDSAPNDDLDMQIVWLEMMRDRGVYPTLTDFSEYWIKHLSPYPWCEYGFFRRNLERGLRPPIAGCFENYFVDEMGSPIRSEVWACVAPGDPQLAAALAWNDAVLDHAGGEGVYGEMFWAAVESAAFVLDDVRGLIQIGLEMIPIWSRISRVIREVLWCRDNGVDHEEARERVLKGFGHDSPCHAPQNHGFTLIGWLYGEDFGDKLCKAVNCGYDTDCTAATLGSVLGLLGGMKGIPEEWRAPVGEAIVLHKFTYDFDCARNVGELTARTAEVAEKMLAARSDGAAFGDEPQVPADLLSLLSRNERAQRVLTRDWQSAITTTGGYDLALHYGGEPVLRPGIAKIVGVSVRQDDCPVAAQVELTAPDGWQVEPLGESLGQQRFRLTAVTVADRNTLQVTADIGGAVLTSEYEMLGPGEAKGYPCRTNVPTCPKCWARIEACVCEE